MLAVSSCRIVLLSLLVLQTQQQPTTVRNINLFPGTLRSQKGSHAGTKLDLRTKDGVFVTLTPTSSAAKKKYIGKLQFKAKDVVLDSTVTTCAIRALVRTTATAEQQRWKFQIRNFVTKRWETLVTNQGLQQQGQWTMLRGAIDAAAGSSSSFDDFLNKKNKLVMRILSNNDSGAIDIDYLKLLITIVEHGDRLQSIDELHFIGAFRLPDDQFGDSNINYAIGIVAYHRARQSLFIVGHDHQSAIAEFPIPARASWGGATDEVVDLPVSDPPLQGFVNYLHSEAMLTNPEEINRITGMMVQADGSLLVNAERWYDAAGLNNDTTFIIRDATDLADSGAVDGFFHMDGAARSAGYLGPIPTEWQDDFGGFEVFTGWSSVWSIVSRYSVGPSLWTFDLNDVLNGNIEEGDDIPATAYMDFPYSSSNDTHISEGAVDWASQGTPGPFAPADPLWNILSDGMYGFFVPGTSTFAVIGSTGGLVTGIGYKAVQENNHTCGGPCPYGVDDYYNYYWFFDVQEILDAPFPHSPRPYQYGIWDIPFDDNGKHNVIGGTYDPIDSILYVVLANAGRVGEDDRPPLIVAFDVPSG